MTLKKWKKVKTEEVYQCGRFYHITKDHIKTPGNMDGIYYVIRKPTDSMIIIPRDNDGMLYVTKQHRYPINDFSIEFPAGYIDEHESRLTAMKRELQEEVGLASNEWKNMGAFNLAAGISDIKVHVYVADNVTATEQESDDPIDKNLHQTMRLTPTELESKIKNGEISAAQTIAAWTLYKMNE